MTKTRLPPAARHPLNPISARPASGVFGLAPLPGGLAQRFPVEVVTCIIDHLWDITKSDPMPFDASRIYNASIAEDGGPEEVLLQATNITTSWNMIAFARTLRGLRGIAHHWSESITEHPWWTENILDLVSRGDAALALKRARHARNNNSAGGAGRAPRPNTSSHDHTLSLLIQAHKYCFFCVLDYHLFEEGSGTIEPAYRRTWTMSYGMIPFCKDVHETQHCISCLRKDDWSEGSGSNTRTRSLTLRDVEDFNTWGGKYAEVCKPCMMDKVERVAEKWWKSSLVCEMMDKEDPNWINDIFDSAHVREYVDNGRGRLTWALMMFGLKVWLEETLQLGVEPQKYLGRKIKDKQVELHAQYKRQAAVVTLNHAEKKASADKLTAIVSRYQRLEHIVALNAKDWGHVISDCCQASANLKIRSGLWLSPEEETVLKSGINTLGSSEKLRAQLTPLEQYGIVYAHWPDGSGTTKVQPLPKEVRLNLSPPLDAVDWLSTHYSMALTVAIRPALDNILGMIRVTSRKPDMEVLDARGVETAHRLASAMTVEDLMEWIRDPRMHYHGWWQQGYHLASPAIIVNNAQGKRKREDDDRAGPNNAAVHIDLEEEEEEEPEVPEVPEAREMVRSTGTQARATGLDVSRGTSVESQATAERRRASGSSEAASTLGANKRRRISGSVGSTGSRPAQPEEQIAGQMDCQQAGDGDGDQATRQAVTDPNAYSAKGALSPNSIGSTSSGNLSAMIRNGEGTDTTRRSTSASSAAVVDRGPTAIPATTVQQPEIPKPRKSLSNIDRIRLSTRNLAMIPRALELIPAAHVLISPATRDIIEGAWKVLVEETLPCECTICVRHLAHWGSGDNQQNAVANPLRGWSQSNIESLVAHVERMQSNGTPAVVIPPQITAAIIEVPIGSDDELTNNSDYDNDMEAEFGDDDNNYRTTELDGAEDDEYEEWTEDDEDPEQDAVMEEPPPGDEV